MAALPDESHIPIDFTPYVPRLVIEWLAENPDREWRELDGTMAFVDISGFTAMSEKLATQGKAGAEQVTEVMNATFDALLGVAYDGRRRTAEVRRRRSARVLRRRGHEARAARAAFEMRQTLRSIGRSGRAAGDSDAEDACGSQLRPFRLLPRRRLASRADRHRPRGDHHSRDGSGLGGRRDPPRPGSAAGLPAAVLGESERGGFLSRLRPQAKGD